MCDAAEMFCGTGMDLDMELLLKTPEDTMELGRMLAEAMAPSRVRALYLFAGLGGGKTTLTRGFVSALPGSADAEVGSPSFTLCNMYPTEPEVLHADLYRLSEGASLPEEMEDALEEGDPLFILEWPEYLEASRHAAERLDLHIMQESPELRNFLDNSSEFDKNFRLAKIEPFGQAAIALMRELQPLLERRFSAARG